MAIPVFELPMPMISGSVPGLAARRVAALELRSLAEAAAEAWERAAGHARVAGARHVHKKARS